MILIVHPRAYGDDMDYCWIESEPGDDHLGCCVGVGNTPAEAEAVARDTLRKLAELPLGTEVGK